jgi:hypothetical protein
MTRMKPKKSYLPVSTPCERGEATMGFRRLIQSFACICLCTLFAACSKAETDAQRRRARELSKKVAPPPWSASPIRVDLSAHLYDRPELDFAVDGHHDILVWHDANRNGDAHKRRLKQIVASEDGRVLSEAVDANGGLTGAFANRFPPVCWRQQWRGLGESSDAISFSDDGRYALSVRRQTQRTDWQPEKTWLAELHERGTKDKLWSVQLTGTRDPCEVAFVEVKHSPSILVAYSGIDACTLSMQDGTISGRFTYGPKDTRETALAYKRKFNIQLADGDPALRFSAETVAVDSKRALLACGDFFSRRVRVVHLDRPHDLVVELNSEDDPYLPKGGTWHVDRVRFRGGRYLIIAYDFSGRGGVTPMEPIEVYDVETWRKCWYVNDPEVLAATISRDGSRLAFMRGMVLEMGPFSGATPTFSRPAQSAPASGRES